MAIHLKDYELAGPKLAEETYWRRLAAAQKALLPIQQAYIAQGLKAMVVFEGCDAAGKGGVIRRLTEQLDPRFCKVWPIGAPGPAEQGRHWLERFWARLPGPGTVAVFDRSWAGRVLVERVEGLLPKADWRRAYDDINAFETMLVGEGFRLVKIYLHISKEEQARRFIDRLTQPHKRWKISHRDFEARALFHEYRDAAEDLFERTGVAAPWTVISGERKWRARLECLEGVTKGLAAGVDVTPPPIDRDLRRLAEKALNVQLPED